MKSGFLTSEFFTMVLSQVSSVMVMFGVIGAGDHAGVAQALATIVAGLVSIFTATTYILGRIDLKKKALDMNAELKV